MDKSVTIHIREVTKEVQERLVMMPYRQSDMESHTHDFFELVYVVKGGLSYNKTKLAETL